MPTYVTLSRALILVAVIVFVLAAFKVPSPVELVALGLAFFAAAHLLP